MSRNKKRMIEISEKKFRYWKNKNEFLNNTFSKIPREDLIKQLKSIHKEHKKELIINSFETFFKDSQIYEKTHIIKDELELGRIKTIKNCIDGKPIIFEIDFEEEDIDKYNLKEIIIPFNNFYISTNILLEIDEELFHCGGFLVTPFMKEFTYVSYFWSRLINDGWAMNSFLIKNNSLKNNSEEFINMKIDYTEEIKNNLLRALQDKYKNIFFHLIKKLLYKIEKREYTSYKKYESNQIVEKQIVYAYDVKAHRRHFWKDSGRFKIPLMSKEGWERKGYGTDELVYRDGELRRDVPYKIIGNFKVDEDKKERENNREIILFERRRFRQEEKLLKILQKIFPNEFIKRHDRKILNGLELDFIIREKRLAFEYEGEQHYDRKLCEEVFKSDFDSLKIRDRNKDKLCIKKDIKLIRIKYDEPLTIQNIRRKLKNGTR